MCLIAAAAPSPCKQCLPSPLKTLARFALRPCATDVWDSDVCHCNLISHLLGLAAPSDHPLPSTFQGPHPPFAAPLCVWRLSLQHHTCL